LSRIVEPPPSHSGDQFIFMFSDVLVLIDQDPSVALDQRVALRLGLVARQAISFQQRNGLIEDLLEFDAFDLLGAFREARADHSHRKAVAGRDRNPPRVVANELEKPTADLSCGVAIVGECQNASGFSRLTRMR
jgi:hypothetical protein